MRFAQPPPSVEEGIKQQRMIMMNNSLLSTATARADTVASSVEIPQLRIRGILAVWAAAALPDGSARLARRAGARGPVRRRPASCRCSRH